MIHSKLFSIGKASRMTLTLSFKNQNPALFGMETTKVKKEHFLQTLKSVDQMVKLIWQSVSLKQTLLVLT